MVGIVRHRQTKGSATDRPRLNHRATPRLHKLEIHVDAYGVYHDVTIKIGSHVAPRTVVEHGAEGVWAYGACGAVIWRQLLGTGS
jgi:hypothetical protein